MAIPSRTTTPTKKAPMTEDVAADLSEASGIPLDDLLELMRKESDGDTTSAADTGS